MTASWQPDILPSWHARLSFQLEKRVNKTIITRLSHLGPVRVLRPYYPDQSGAVHVYLLHPPGALVGGDLVEFDIEAASRTRALITTPSAGKFNRALTNLVQNQRNLLRVGDSARLEWLPQENIFFNEAQAKTETQVEVDASAFFAGWDISCFGRPASGEHFDSGRLHTQFQVRQAGVPVLNEVCRFSLPGMNSAFEFAMQKRTVSGLFCANHIDTALPEASLTLLEQHQQVIAATKVKDWIFIRYFGDSAEQAKHLFIAIWSEIKKSAWNEDFIPPRIWSY